MIKAISIDELKSLIDNNEDFILIDARQKFEFDEGHIKDAILIPHDEINERIDEISDYKDNKIVVYCRTQNRSKVVADMLKFNGFSDVSVVKGGMVEWEEKIVRKLANK